MKTIRIRLKRFLFGVFILILFCTVNYIYYKWYVDDSECFVSKETHKKLGKLLENIEEALKALNLTYFMCYQTLWAALKVKKPLPWQKDIDLCVLNKEISAIDEGYLARTFKRYGLSINYNSGGGYYRVFKFGNISPYAKLTVFEEDLVTHQMRRVGWIHRMLPPNSCEELNCFPPELISTPLPKIAFGDYLLPAPSNGIEIQKYLYPYSWWKEITPTNCPQLNDKDLSNS